MPPLDDDGGDDGDIVFRDLILLMLTGFVTVAVLLLPHINPKAAGRQRQGHGRRPATSWSRRAGRRTSTATSTCGSRRRATCRSATPTRAARCSTCCATISASQLDAHRPQLRDQLLARHRRRRVHGQPASLPQPGGQPPVPVTVVVSTKPAAQDPRGRS